MTARQACCLVALCASTASAWNPQPPGALRCARLTTTRCQHTAVAMTGGEDEAAKRMESGKAAISSTVVGMTAALPFLLLGPGAFTAPAWELQADGLALMLFLFGVVYRYAVRTDENEMLKQGVVGAFVITRSWALIAPPATCSVVPLNCGAPLGYFNWDMILQGSFAAVETGAACAAAAYALEFSFEKGWIKRCE